MGKKTPENEKGGAGGLSLFLFCETRKGAYGFFFLEGLTKGAGVFGVVLTNKVAPQGFYLAGIWEELG